MIVCAAQFLQNPTPDEVAARSAAGEAKVRSHDEDFNSGEMLRTPHFYMLYIDDADDGHRRTDGDRPSWRRWPTLSRIGAAALTVALSLNPIGNGASRMFWGWVSDHIGRERTMFIAFLLQAACAVERGDRRHADRTPVSSFAWRWFSSPGARFTRCFLRRQADFFGAQNASSNYGFLYSAKASLRSWAVVWRPCCLRKPAPGTWFLRLRRAGFVSRR